MLARAKAFGWHGWGPADFDRLLHGDLVTLDLNGKTEAGIWAMPFLARGSASTLTELDIRFQGSGVATALMIA